jgi:hypothetical protein
VKRIYWFILIFVFGLAVRFYSFGNNVYFGFDEARDALVSESIYLNSDFKLIGPPATGDTGLYHGPAFWYLIGPIYLLFQGNLLAVSALFRLVNALGIFLVYGISQKLFSSKVGLISAILYAVSFEQSQYSLYVGKESLALICWLTIIYFFVSIYKKGARSIKIGLPMIALCFGLMLQFNIIYAGYGLGLLAIGMVLFPQLKVINYRSWIVAGATLLFTLSTYVVAELKYDFREIRSALKLISSGFGIMSPGESKYTLYRGKYLTMFRDNIVGLNLDIEWHRLFVALIAISFTIWIFICAFKKIEFRILFIWLMTWAGVMLAGGHMAYYTNVATSVAILIGIAFLLDQVTNKKIVMLIIGILIIGNLNLVYQRREKGLIQAIKPQPFMNLKDERAIIDEMYGIASGRGFTIRLTGIPYKIQTVWFYLLREYGYKKYGYYPYWEHGNIAGFPGQLPTPGNGTTCLRFLVREPMTGLPVSLVELDQKVEDYYSKVVTKQEIGLFTFQERVAHGDCHDIRAENENKL